MLVIDRFEGDLAVIDSDGEIFNIKKDSLPESAKEGDVITLGDNGYLIDEEETKKRRAETLALLKKLGL